MSEREWVCERDIDRERGRERHIETGRQTLRHTHSELVRESVCEREIERERESDTERQRVKKRVRERENESERVLLLVLNASSCSSAVYKWTEDQTPDNNQPTHLQAVSLPDTPNKHSSYEVQHTSQGIDLMNKSITCYMLKSF